MNLESFTSAFGLVDHGMGIIRHLTGLMPKGAEREAAEKSIAEAQEAFALAKVKSAQEMGYELCRCTWPPQICLRKDGQDNICPKCGFNAFIGSREDTDDV